MKSFKVASMADAETLAHQLKQKHRGSVLVRTLTGYQVWKDGTLMARIVVVVVVAQEEGKKA